MTLYYVVDSIIQDSGVSCVYKGTIVTEMGDKTGLKVNSRKYDFKEGSQYVLKIYNKKSRYDNEHSVFKLIVKNPHPYLLTPVCSDRRTLSAFFKAGDDDLFNYCQIHGSLSNETKNIIASRIIEALKHLHSLGIVHADLKLENVIYFGEPENIQLIDFTHAKVIKDIDHSKKWEQMIGTSSLSPPELGKGFDYGHVLKIDSWLLALILYEMYTWTNPFQKGKRLSLKRHLIDDPEIYKTIAALTHQDPEARLSVMDIDNAIFK